MYLLICTPETAAAFLIFEACCSAGTLTPNLTYKTIKH